MSALIDMNSGIILGYSANSNKFMRKCVYTIFNFSMVLCFEITWTCYVTEKVLIFYKLPQSDFLF